MKSGLGSLLLGRIATVVRCGLRVRADADLVGDPGQRPLAIKNACSDKQRSPNCVGENISPPLAWSGVPEGTKSFALLLFDPEGRAAGGVSHMVVYGIPGIGDGFRRGRAQPALRQVCRREEHDGKGSLFWAWNAAQY